MGQSERQKMAGEWYCRFDTELDALRAAAHNAVHRHNMMPLGQRANFGPALSPLFAGAAVVCNSARALPLK